MNKFLNKLKYFWPVLGIFITVFILFLTNYKPGTYLTGWDNLHPEFNFGLNIQRSIFAVWQEYQGLGLLGGMGHAADIVHQVFLLFLSPFIPNSMLRYTWTFLMLFAGSTGTYFFLKTLFFKKDDLKNITAAFFGEVFYLLNLATIQTFYAPFEAFIAHFASLPWLLLSSILFLHSPNKKMALFVSFILFISTPQAYIPTLFVVYILSFLLYFSVAFFQSKTKKKLLSSGTKLAILIGIINSFWLVPFTYFTLTNSSVNINSKINQMATQTIFSQNKEFGKITDTILLKGFWFQNIDLNKNGDFSYMLAPWKNHLSHLPVIIIGFVFFALILLGLYTCVKTKNKATFPFVILFVFAFTMLATAAPPFSWIDELFRLVPLFNQAFRFPFTKFSILAGFLYSVFFALGFYTLANIASLYLKRFYLILLTVLFLSLIAIFSFPAFQGHLIYDKERLVIPQEYFQLFNFFDKQDKNTRIANFPQQTFWGWTSYKWGYGGSGFLWYGIKQPILDRAFDVWSRESEQYYLEASNALYSKDAIAFENVLNKYQISWILMDKNIINPSSPKSLFTKESEAIFDKIPSVSKVKIFGNIDVYKVDLKDKPKSFIYAVQNPQLASNAFWKNQDKAYENFGTYQNSENGTLYPFSGLFSGKTEKENAASITENASSIKLKREIDTQTISFLSIPAFSDTEHIIPVRLELKKDEKNNFVVTFSLVAPQIFLDGKKVWGESLEIPAFIIPEKSEFPLTLDVNGVLRIDIKKENLGKPFSTTFLSLDENNTFTLSSRATEIVKPYVISPSLLKSFQQNEKKISINSSLKKASLEVEVPKIQDEYLSFALSDFSKQKVKNCDNYRRGQYSGELVSNSGIKLSSKNATACIDYYKDTLLHSEGYAVFLKSKNIKGRGLHFWVLNEDEKFAPIDTYVTKTKNFYQHAFALPPMEKNGRGYSFHMENISIEDEEENEITNLSAYQIPYRFVSDITFVKNLNPIALSKNISDTLIDVKHPDESQYFVDLQPIDNIKQPNTLVLSQSYSKGWKAYLIQNSKSGIKNRLNNTFPFIFGKEIKNHTVINGWSNGWVLENTKKVNITILYLPQYLEYAGFALLFGLIFYIGVKFLKRN